ncbi:MAG: nitroreductase family protein [Spongiibacteraceae bacterium]
MDALALLHTRNSVAQLTDPAPTGDVLSDMIKAGMRAPDHGWLRPWRFLTISGDDRNHFGALMVAAANKNRSVAGEPLLNDQEAERLAAKALRAPLILVVVASIKDSIKVPVIEQQISAGCAAHGILLAAQAHGFAGIWRTGVYAFDKTVKRGLGLLDREEITGFIYLGTPACGYKVLRELAVDDFCQQWSPG